MFYHKNAIYPKPIMWQKDYYSFDQFCELLCVAKNSKAYVKLQQAIADKFYQFTYTGFEDVYQFERMRATANNNNLVTPRVLSKQKHPCFLRVYDRGEEAFLISKGGVLAFLDAHQNDLCDLGVSKSILLVLLNNMPIYDKAPTRGICLWDFVKKFTKNSKNVKVLSDFVVDNFFNTYFEQKEADGTVSEEAMFFYVKGKRRATTFYFNAEALPFFKAKYRSLIHKKEAEIEAQNEFVSLRYFLLETSASAVSNKTIKDFILKNALHDTFQEKDQHGHLVEQKMFLYNKGALSIRKKAILPFVQKYHKNLKQLGVLGLDHILQQEKKRANMPDGTVTVSQLLVRSQLGHYLIPFQNLLHSKKAKAMLVDEQTGQKRPLIYPYYVKNKMRYYIFEKDVQTFFKQFYDAFVSVGVSKYKLDELLGGNAVPKRSSKMIAMRSVFYKLGFKSSLFVPLRKEIEATFLNDTYEYVGKDQKVEVRPVFVKTKTLNSVDYVFENQTAMQAFVEKRRDFFLKKGVSLMRLKDVTGEEPIIKLNENLVALSALAQLFNLKNYHFNTYVNKNYLQTTYLNVNEQGEAVQEKMFIPVRLPSGHIGYAIQKKAIPQFRDMIQMYLIRSQRQKGKA